MAATLLVLASAVAFTGGALVSWLIAERRSRGELDELENQMRGKVEERYRAYVALERRVRAVMEAFDRSEGDLRRRLHNQSESILALREALERHDGFDLVSAEQDLVPELSKSTDFLGMPGAESALSAAQEPVADALAQIDEWERKVEGAALRSTAELERQSADLLAITQHVKRLEPAGRGVHALESELAAWKVKHAELERLLLAQGEAVQRYVDELRPVAREVAHGEEALRELREGYEGRLREREADIEGLRERATVLERELDELRSQLEGAREELVLVCAERDSLDLRLADETQRVRELEPFAAEAQERALRIDELEARIGRGREELARAEQRLEERTRAFERNSGELERRLVAADQAQKDLGAQVAALGTRATSLEQELVAEREQALRERERTEAEIASLREASRSEIERHEREREDAFERARVQAEALSAKERLVAERERQVEDLTSEVEELRTSLARASESLHGEQSRIGTLMRELGDVKERYEHRDSTLHEAQNVLDALRPMIEALEQKLSR